MRIEIENIQPIENEYLKDFELKTSLTEVELYGLELILSKLVLDGCEDIGAVSGIGECVDNVHQFTVHKKDRLDVLDGREDIIRVGYYIVTSVHLTKNGIVMLKCIQEDENGELIEDSVYYASLG